MSPIARVDAATALPLAPAATAGGASGGGVLLPPADPPTLGQLQGSMANLYLVMSQLRDAQVAGAKTRADGARMEQEIAQKEHDEAIERARRAAAKGGLFDWIAKDTGLAGVVGLVTFNYALVAADVAAHKLDLVHDVKIDVVDAGAVLTGRYDVIAADVLLRKTELAPDDARAILEKCGIPKDAPGVSDEDVKPVARKALMTNLFVLSVAGTILSAGSATGLCVALAGLAISVAGAKVAEERALDGVFGEGSSRWIGLGMQIGGALTTGTSAFVSSGALISEAAKAGGAVASGAATTTRAADRAVVTIHERESDDFNAAAEEAKLRLMRLDRLLEFLIDGIKEASESSRKAGEAIQGAIATADQTQVALAAGTKV